MQESGSKLSSITIQMSTADSATTVSGKTMTKSRSNLHARFQEFHETVKNIDMSLQGRWNVFLQVNQTNTRYEAGKLDACNGE